MRHRPVVAPRAARGASASKRPAASDAPWRAGVLALALLGLEALITVTLGAFSPLSAAALLIAPGLALTPFLPDQMQSSLIRWSSVPILGAAAASTLLISASAVGLPLTGTSVRLLLLALVLVATAVAMRVLAGAQPDEPATVEPFRPAAALLLGAALCLALTLRILASDGDPVTGSDWAKYLLYGELVAREGSLLIDNPYWMLGMPYREDPGVPSLFGAYLLLSGDSADVLVHGLSLFATLSILSIFVFVAVLWGSAAGVFAAGVYAAIPLTHTIESWHGLANVYAFVFLPLALLPAAMLLRGRTTWRWIGLLALMLVALIAAHRLSFLVAASALAVAGAVALIRAPARTARFGLLTLAVSLVLGAGVAVDLVQRNAGSGGVQDYRVYTETRVGPDKLHLLAQDLTWPGTVAGLAALAALIFVPKLRSDPARWVLLGLLAACAALTYAWVFHLPSAYFRGAYFVPLFIAAAAAAVWRLLPPWPGYVAAVALVAVIAFPARGQADNARRFYTHTDAASDRGIDYVKSLLGPRDVVVTDRCWGFISTYQLRRPMLAALQPWDILPADEAEPARLARGILYGVPAAAEPLASKVGARYALVNPTCDDGRGGGFKAPTFGTPVYASTRLVVLDLRSPTVRPPLPESSPVLPEEPEQEVLGN